MCKSCAEPGFPEQKIQFAQDDKETPDESKGAKVRQGMLMLLLSYPMGLAIGLLSSILFVPTTLFQAWVITKIQSWYPLQDIGVPTLSMHQAVGALLVLGALRCIFISSKANVKFSGMLQKEHETASVVKLAQVDNNVDVEYLLKYMGIQVAAFSFTLAIAWVCTWFV